MSVEPIIIQVDCVWCKLYRGNAHILNAIDIACSYSKENYQFSDAYRAGHWDGRIHKFSVRTHKFPTGLLPKVVKILDDQNYPYEIKDVRPGPKLNLTTVAERLGYYGVYPRPYQFRGIEKGLEHKNMMFWWPTASGKTVLFGGLITAYDTKTLILVNRRDLVSQHTKFLSKNTSFKVGGIGEGIWDPGQITVALTQSLWAKKIKSKKKLVKFLEGIEYLIIDEAHHGEAKTFRTPANLCSGAVVRHGFSGTPYSLTNDDIELECVTGPVLSRVSISYLISKGYLSIPFIKVNRYKTKKLEDLRKWKDVYNQGIVHCDERNELACQIVRERYDQNLLTLVTVNYKKHGTIIHDELVNRFGVDSREIDYLSGNTPQSVRDIVKAKFLNGDTRVIIVTTIWNEGVDVPEANALVKCDGYGGSSVADDRGIRSTIQQVGRILRKSKPDGAKDVDVNTHQFAYVDDFYDAHHEWLKKHSNNRIATYKIEPEFRLEIS